jgi:HSP20 family protein
MATETGSTNGQRTGQQTGDGGQSGKSAQAARAGESGSSRESGTSRERGQQLSSQRGQTGATRGRGMMTPFGGLDQSPFASLWQISREMDRLMDAFFGGGLGFGASSGAQGAQSGYAANALWTPQIEVRQREDSLVIHVDLPGVKQEDIQLEATEEGLAISGQRTEQREEGEQGYRRTERSYGSFYRLIPLPDGARIDNAKASMHNGVLEVTVPLERPQRRRIQIESEQSRS